MTYRDLMEWVDSDPFVPFRLNLSDGRTIDIHFPSLVWPGRRTVMVGFPDKSDEPDVPERHQTVSLMHIVSIEPLSLAQAP